MENFTVLYTLIVVACTVFVLVLDKFKPSLVFLSAVVFLLIGGVITTTTFVAGLSNTSILSIFLLIIITGAVNEHFNPSLFFDKIFQKTKTSSGFIFRMGGGVALVSSFMNNTPVVAMMMPYVYNWGKTHNVSPSKLLMPLSFAAISGGVITLIGTSTNLVLNGLLIANEVAPLTFLDFLIPGFLITLVAVLFLAFFAPKILSARKDILDKYQENRREYLIETKLVLGGAMVGKSIEQAGLRNLEGAYVTAVVRGVEQIVPVRPDEVLKANDILLFAGETSSIMNLLNNGKGLELSKKEKFALPTNVQMLEAVVSQNSGLDRNTVKDVGFREKYDAAIIGIHRKGEKLNGKIGDINLKTGDLLLLAAGYEFYDKNKRNEDLIVINKMGQRKEISILKRNLFWVGSVTLVLLALFGVLNLFEALLGVVFVQAAAGMVTLGSLKKNISYDLLIVLISSLCMGQALISSGASSYLINLAFAGAGDWSPIILISVIFIITFVLTSLITNVAAISIIFPVVLSLSIEYPIHGHLFFVTAAFAASCCFATPFAYQTNLMVVELGNYKFSDFLKLGLPLSLIYAIIFIGYQTFHYNLI